jgi:hypothetical protein
MTRRIVLAATALVVIGTGVGAASAATSHQSAPSVTAASSPEHQLCLLLYRSDPTHPQHICVNW